MYKIDNSKFFNEIAEKSRKIVVTNLITCGWEHQMDGGDFEIFYFDDSAVLLQWLQIFIAERVCESENNKQPWIISGEEQTPQTYKFTSFTNPRSWESGWEYLQRVAIYFPKSSTAAEAEDQINSAKQLLKEAMAKR